MMTDGSPYIRLFFFGDVYRFKTYILIQVQINETLKQEIAQVLQQRFGVPPEQQAAYIDSYAQTYFDRRAWV